MEEWVLLITALINLWTSLRNNEQHRKKKKGTKRRRRGQKR